MYAFLHCTEASSEAVRCIYRLISMQHMILHRNYNCYEIDLNMKK